jgi:ferric-dicitrate binding protein FerR (iron transport regulator)
LYSWLGTGDHEEYVLATTSSSIESITLDDGSSVTLRPHSSFFVVDLDSHRYRLEGEALFEVTRNPNREFVVETAFASVTVLGTTFDVSTWGNETSVFLSHGKVRVDHSMSARSLLLEPGQAAVVDRNMVSRALSDAANATYLDWLNNELSFDQSPAYRVAAELGHHFGVALVIPADFANETLSGRILLTSLDQGLDDLSAVLGGRFDPRGDSTFVLAPN